MRRISVLGLLAVVAVLIGFVGCGSKTPQKEITVLVRMMPAQQRFFQNEIVAPFEKANNCKVKLSVFENQWDIERMLKLEAGKKNPEIALVKTPFEMTRVLVSKGYMAPLTSIEDSAQVIQDLAEYDAVATGFGFIDGSPYYIPRKLETRIFYYSKSKVADAVSKFDGYKKELNAMLKKENGYGLPAGYALEKDPAEWDFYDLYVVGVIWSKEKYNDISVGRLAHRGARYGGTSLFLVDRALQLGATTEDLLTLTADKTAEMFLWENKLVSAGAYNPSIWNDSWKGSNIYDGIKDGKVFAAYLQQIDCFIIHGWDEDPGMPSYLADKSDMGLSIVPKAVSFELDKNGKPLYEGSRDITVGGWWWGVPKTSPDAELAYKFARYVTNKENQAKECSKFGMIPVRKDILRNIPQAFNQGWVGNIFKVSVNQINSQLQEQKLVTVPLVPEFPQIGQNYIEAWYKLAVDYDAEKDGSMDLSTMKMRLGAEFLTKQQAILGDDYPQK